MRSTRNADVNVNLDENLHLLDSDPSTAKGYMPKSCLRKWEHKIIKLKRYSFSRQNSLNS